MLTITIKPFQELTVTELYKILQLRNEVFIVEQNCPYQDLDDKDLKALHVIGTKEDEIVAYTRIFKSGDSMKQASIGRVVVKQNERKYGYGQDIMKFSIEAIEDHFKENYIQLSAQTYLKKFYNSFAFLEKGEEYLEDNIPHILMEKK